MLFSSVCSKSYSLLVMTKAGGGPYKRFLIRLQHDKYSQSKA